MYIYMTELVNQTSDILVYETFCEISNRLLVHLHDGISVPDIRLRGHKSETISLLISISLSVKEYIEEK